MKTLDDKVNDACHRIEDLYHETDGKCYVSFSGGKDSTVLLALIKLCEEVYTIPENGIPAVFSNTGIELGVTVEFVKWVKGNYYENTQIIRPDHSFDWCLKTYGKPVKSKLRSEFLGMWRAGKRTANVYRNLVQGVTSAGRPAVRTKLADKDMHMISDEFNIKVSPMCCKILKKKPFIKYAKANGIKGYAYGIRASEGGARELNTREKISKGGKICTSITGGIIKKAPLIDWSDEDLDEFVERYAVPLSEAYTRHGFARTGCMLCPYSQQLHKDLRYLYDHEPNRYKAAMHWLKDVYIAQDVRLPFDEAYERERERTWRELYEPMRQEMLRKYRPNSRLIKDDEQMTIFDYLDE